ncbi:Predicted esterase [gamma proteobacterium HdN1]|nr:Predicted esterase [gamma proteobacterium HdN1]
MNAIVETRNGRLQGIAHADHLEFRGIPYALPPLGRLRLSAPQPIPAWEGILRADRFTDPCPQALNPLHGITRTSEDCLSLNIWAPPLNGHNKPVMVWIHGGGFSSGAGSQLMYHGKDLALHGDTIVITLNYRLGVFGFLHLDHLLSGTDNEFPPASNVGLRDIVVALKWVQENIEAFGGDPSQVTLFGESAGAMAITCLLTSPYAKGLFKRAILQSGGADFILTRDEADEIARHFLKSEPIAQVLGTASGSAALALLRNLSVETLLKGQQACQLLYYNRGPYLQQVIQRGMTLIPVIDGDFLPQAPLKALQEGVAKEIPLLISCTRDEWNLFLHAPEADGTTLAKRRYAHLDKSRLISLCERRLPGLGERAANLYEEMVPRWIDTPTALDIFSAFESDRLFRIPSIRIAEAQANFRKDVYMAHFDFDEGPMGACHGIDLPLVFGHTQTPMGTALIGNNTANQRLSEQVQGAWIAFARSGNPSSDAIGCWSPWLAGAPSTLIFSRTAHMGKDPVSLTRKLWEGIL